MSAINEEEINEVLTKKESIEEVENDISTEPKTEPIEVIAEGENMEIIEEKKNSKEDLIDTNAIEESEQIATDYIDDVPQQDEMNIDNPEEMNDEPVLINDQPTLYNNEPMLINDQPTLYNNEPMLINDVKEDPEISHMKGGSKKTSQTQLGSAKSINKSVSMATAEHGMIDKAFTEPASEQNEMRIYNGPIYCIEQVRIPPELPDIMKNYAKHIIRTQPDDVIIESYEYFKRLNKLRNSSIDEKEDSLKDIDFNKQTNHNNILDNSNFSINSENHDAAQNKNKKMIQLSPLELESFYERLLDYSNGNEIILISDIRNMSEDANISQNDVNEAIVVGSWENEVEWIKFWSLIVAGSCNNLMSTLKIIINIIGDDNLIPLNKITTVTKFLLESDPNSNENTNKTIISALNEREGDVIEKEQLYDILSILQNN